MRKCIILFIILAVLIGCTKDSLRKNAIACFNYSPNNDLKVGDTIFFSSCSENSSNYFWDFGDGQSSNETAPWHIYVNAGSFKVRIVVRNDNSIDSLTEDIHILQKIDLFIPQPYFPVFPNSYWIYLKSNGDTIIHKTDTAYILWSDYNPAWGPYDTTKYYVMKYDEKPVKKYSIFEGKDSWSDDGWLRILPDSLYIGNLFLERYHWPNKFVNVFYSGEILTIDTTLILNSVRYDSVLIVLEYCGSGIGQSPYGKTYYAKNIGIIKKELWNYNYKDSIISSEELLKYHIEK
jgi:PKD repeat protein